MSEWISVEERLPPLSLDEVEIAWWDGTLMCRAFGVYDHEQNDWYSTSEQFFATGDPKEWVITHWRECTPLPEPPDA